MNRALSLVGAALAGTALAGSVFLPAPVAALEGRYVGNVTDSSGEVDASTTTQNFDLSSRSSLSGSLDLDLHMGLLYRARLDGRNQDLLNSRFNGELRHRSFRLRGDFTPWQDRSAGPTPPRSRNAQLNLLVTPANLPRLELGMTRGNVENLAGASQSEDRRARLSWERGALQTGAAYRRIETESFDSSAPAARTEEVKGGVAINPTLGRVSLHSAYELLHSDYRSAARRREFLTHLAEGGINVRPWRRLGLGATALARWGDLTDNAPGASRDIDERIYSANVDYQPWNSLNLQLGREYQERLSTVTERDKTDYLRFQANYRRPLVRQVMFQAGYQQTLDLVRTEDVPATTAYAQVDGPLRRGLEGRAELRTSTSTSEATGRQWRRLLQLRGDPIRETHLEATWRVDDTIRPDGQDRGEEEWAVTGSLAPESSFGFTGSFRWITSTGLIARKERVTNLLVSWKSGERSSLSADWARRVTESRLGDADETVLGLNLQAWLPREYRVAGAVRNTTASGRRTYRSYTLALEKHFE